MKCILLLSRVNTNNLGDQLIGRSMLKLFSPLGEIIQGDVCSSNDNITINCDDIIHKYSCYNIDDKDCSQKDIAKKGKSLVAGNFKNKIKNGFINRAKWLWSNHRIFKVILSKKYDAIVIGGGELISPSFAYALYLWSIMIKIYQRKAKVILFGVGVTACPPKERKLLSRIVNLSYSIFVRDDLSKLNMERLYYKESSVIPDVAFFNDFSYSGKREYSLYGLTSIERIHKHNKIKLSEKEYFEKTFQELSILSNEDNYKLFYTTQDDCIVCAKFANYCKHTYNYSLDIVRVQTLDDLIRTIQGANNIYTPRMHGCIVAQLSGGSVHPIIISDKMESYKYGYLCGFDISLARSILFETVNNFHRFE